MAYDAFLQLDGLSGESTDSKFAGAIEILSFSLGASNPSTVGSATTGSGAGKVSLSNFNIMKRTDSASTTLFQNCASGDHFSTATVTLRKAGKTALVYLVYQFTEVYVDSIQWSGSAGGGEDTPSESVSFSFASVHVTYTPQNTDGSGGTPLEGGWSVTTNQPA